MPDPKRLTIDWEKLELAFQDVPGEFGDFAEQVNYFDLQTGQVICINDDIRSALGGIEQELSECLTEHEEVTLETVEKSGAFQRLPEWEQEMVWAAADVHFGDFSRYEDIPHFESHESYGYMEDFIETVRDAAMQNRLSDAIHKRSPFRNFSNVLADDRRLERQWGEYEMRRQHETMLQWLRVIGVEPANPEGREVDWQPLPDLRNIMFAEVRRFVRFARDFPGVERIALFGSLATDKEFPRDIDLLVTVSNDCDLTELARLGRQLSGHMLSQQAGGEVFLADPGAKYLGRTCPWRRCGPGTRVRCDALHCGARPYLHDDFNAIRLKQKLITRPPVALWPEPSAGEEVPADVRKQLIEPLAIDHRR